MLINRGLARIGKGQHLIEERHVASLFDIFARGDDDPQRIVGAGVLDTVNHAFDVGRMSDGGRFECWRFLLFRVEPIGIEQVQAVALADLRFQ